MRALLATVISFSLLVCLSVSVIAADGGSVRLGIEAVDSEQSYFDLTLNPGESAELTVMFANHGEVPTGATVFPADVYTIIGGGMGMRELGDPPTGVTTWLSFESTTMDLQPDEGVQQTFSVTVPEDAEPGDYITSIVIQNTEPRDIDTGSASFSQTVRQGIAVAIDVPGDRQPEMEFGEVHHSVVGGSSVIEVDLANTGNAHLRPAGTFTLLEANGSELASSPIGLDTIFAGTNTVIEITLTGQLPDGDYLISVTVEDDETGASASSDDLMLNIESPDPTPEPQDGLAGAVETVEETVADNRVLTLLLAGVLFLIGLLTLAAVVMLGRTRQEPSPAPVPAPAAQSPTSDSAPAPPAKRREERPAIRQIVPPGRNHYPDSE